MAPLTGKRLIKRRTSQLFQHPAAAAVEIFEGALVCLDATGNATPGATATTLKPAGVARYHCDNSAGAAGDKQVDVERGCFSFINAGGVTRAHIGGTAYIVDDQTVAHDNGGNTRSAAGTIRDVDADGVWVEI